MGSLRILIDTNICIDAIQKRKPFDIQSQKILDYSEKGIIDGLVAAHSFDTIFYILSQTASQENVYRAIEGLRRTVDIANVSREIIDQALQIKWPDFEDAVHYQAALAAGCEAVVTRNPKDFLSDGLPVLSPQQFLDEINKNDS